MNKKKTKHISCECKCTFDGRKCNSDQKWKEELCLCECKKLKDFMCAKKNYIWNPSTFACKNRKYLGSINGDSASTCDKNIEVTKNVSTKIVPTITSSKLFQIVSTKKKVTCKIENFYILLVFFLITLSLLITVVIYCCFIEHW